MAMEATIDSMGRVVVPKAFRDALGSDARHQRSTSRSTAPGLSIVPGGRTARLVEEDGVLVATSEHEDHRR